MADADRAVLSRLTAVELTAEEKALAMAPGRVDPAATEFLAAHWHPEWLPLDLIERRVAASFPAAQSSLAIPTQHNRVLVLGPWAGVEADAFDKKYGLKVHILIHFRADKMPQAGTFLKMMERTYNYRAHQLFDILRRLTEAGGQATARDFAQRLARFIEEEKLAGSERDEMLKNRLLPDFIKARSENMDPALLAETLAAVAEVKKKVKADINPAAFYSPQEIVEEARSFGAGVVIPHPPAFWPVLLSGLDVDGWEVWNPSTPRHAVFLTEALARANAARRRRPLLAFMGDDTHMSSKIRPDTQKGASREIGFQDPWAEPEVAAALAATGQSRHRTIEEYRGRLLAG